MLLGFDWRGEEVTFCGEVCPVKFGAHACKVLHFAEDTHYANIYVGF